MAKFKEYRIDQPMLFPPSINDYVPKEHLSRFVSKVVEILNTEDIENKYSNLGQNTYHPKLIIKILFYGYATGYCLRTINILRKKKRRVSLLGVPEVQLFQLESFHVQNATQYTLTVNEK